MTTYLGKDPCDLTYDWKEWHLQAYVVMMARRLGILVHGDQNGASKTPKGWSQAAATGMLKGWPDLCFVMDRLIFVELKRGKERRSPEQVSIHDALNHIGMEVHTVHACCPAECWNKVKYILDNQPISNQYITEHTREA